MQFDQLRRREFIMLLGGGAVVWPLAARAQQMRRVGVLMNTAATDAIPVSYVAAFVQALARFGWIEGQNIRVDVRWNAADAALARIYAAQLIGLQPDVILSASTLNLMILRQATNTVPIVFVQVSDPVAQGFVPNLTRPGGNLTGFSAFDFSIGGKWVDLLKQVAPELARVAVIFNPDNSPQTRFFLRSIESAGQALDIQVVASPVRAFDEFEATVKRFAQQPNGGLIFPTGGLLNIYQNPIIETASRYRLPTIGSNNADFARKGGLLYYGWGGETADHYRQAASYVDRILRGEKPGDLPVQLAAKFVLIINMKTAKALGLTVPIPLLGLADQVIE
jgi:putative ABC transport system substrate-binding protein